MQINPWSPIAILTTWISSCSFFLWRFILPRHSLNTDNVDPLASMVMLERGIFLLSSPCSLKAYWIMRQPNGNNLHEYSASLFKVNVIWRRAKNIPESATASPTANPSARDAIFWPPPGSGCVSREVPQGSAPQQQLLCSSLHGVRSPRQPQKLVMLEKRPGVPSGWTSAPLQPCPPAVLCSLCEGDVAHTSGVPVAPSVALVRVGVILTRTPFVACLALNRGMPLGDELERVPCGEMLLMIYISFT